MDLSKSIDRFLEPQKTAYPTALAEVSRGRKESHWMWYIFPQLRGLGRSTLAWYYGLEDLAEARVYLDHPVLGPLLRGITAAVLALPEDYKLPVYLFYYEGYPTAEIARMLGVAPATVRSRLNRARKKLKLTLGGDTYDG